MTHGEIHQMMNVILLTRFHSQNAGPEGMPMAEGLAKVALQLGCTVTVVNPADVVLNFDATGSFPVMWKTRAFPLAELVLPIARWDDQHTWDIAETLRSWGRAVAMPQRIPLGDHINMARLLARRGIPTPRSWVLSNPEQLEILLPEVTFPLLMRSRYGGRGRKVAVVQHSGEAYSHAKYLSGSGQPFLVQDLPEPLGEDIRVLVVGGKVLASIARQAPAGFVRPKESGNPRVKPFEITPYEAQLALKAAELYGAPFCAVSLLRTAQGPMMLELSRVPSLSEFASACQQDFSKDILEHLVVLAKRLQASAVQGNVEKLALMA